MSVGGQPGVERAVGAFDTSATAVFGWLCRIGGPDRAVEVLPTVYSSIVHGGASDEASLMAVGIALLGADPTVRDRAVFELCVVRGWDPETAASVVGTAADDVRATLAEGLADAGTDPSAIEAVLRRDEVWLDDETRTRCRAAITGDLDGPLPAGRTVERPRTNARIAVTVAIVVAVLVAVVVFVRNNGASDAAPFARQPTLRWQHQVDGYIIATLHDGDSLFIVEQVEHSAIIERLDLRSGRVRWSASIDDAGSHPQTGPSGLSAMILDGSIAVVRSGLGDDQALFEMVSESDGSVRWTAQTATRTVGLDPSGFVFNASDTDGGSVQAVDDGSRTLSPPLPVDAWAGGVGSILIDVDGVVSRLDDGSTTPSGGFRFPHPKTISTMTSLQDGGAALVVGSGPAEFTQPDGTTTEGPAVDNTAVTRVGVDGTALWTVDPGLGSINEIEEMNEGRLLVTGTSAFVIMDIVTGKVLTEQRSYQRKQIGRGPNGRDVVFGFQGTASGGATAVDVVDNVDGALRTLTTLDGFIAPELTPLDDGTALVTSTPGDDTTGTLVTRVDLATGTHSWEMPLESPARLSVIGDALLVTTASPASSTLSVFGP